MGSLSECRIEGFICRLCSQIDRNVIHIYTDEGLQKKLEQKINVYLKINLSRYDPLPKVICLPCDAKLEQHHRFIQRVIQNQKKIHGERPGGERPIIPLLEQHLRVRVSPVIREDGSGTNTYNIEAISSSDSDSTSDDEQPVNPVPQQPQQADISLNTTNNDNNELQQLSDMEALSDNDSSSSSSSSGSSTVLNEGSDVAMSPTRGPVEALWTSSSSSSSSSETNDVIPAAADDEI